jgi:HSP20 family molecular chaperone IbpA
MNFEKISREIEELQRRMMESMLGDFEELEKRIQSGEIQGEWEFRPFERPGARGFIAKGFFATPRPLEKPENILPPLKPSIKDPREPLYDLNAGEDNIHIFIELPGVEEKDIETRADKQHFEVKAGQFQAKIDISRWMLDTGNIKTEYRNGVLNATIPRIKTEEHLI